MKTIYHGGTKILERPNVDAGRKGLDFGKGFYVTELFDQAQRWAEKSARQRLEPPIINEYIFDDKKAESNYKHKIFTKYDQEWLDFIVSCRKVSDCEDEYDYVEGGIANDRVIDTVEGYINGTIDANHALRELAKHQPNHQICFRSQKLVEECVIFVKAK